MGVPWYQRTFVIQAIAVVVSLAMTGAAVLQDAMLNADGVLYLLAAESLSKGDLATALALSELPLYSLLVSAMHDATGLGFESAAYLVNALLQALIVFSFIGMVAEVEGENSLPWLSALVILAFASFNDYRSDIIRGFGYWAFVLLGCWMLVRYSKRFNPWALAWALGLLILAALFRIEGFVLLALAPLAVLLVHGIPMVNRVRMVMLVYTIALVLGLLAWVGIRLVEGEAVSIAWSLPFEHAQNLSDALFIDIGNRAQIIEDTVLSRYSREYALLSVWIILLVILIADILGSLGIFFGVFVFAGFLTATRISCVNCKRILVFFLAVNFLILGAFVVTRGFLTGRYVLLFSLLALSVAPIGVRAVYGYLNTKSQAPGAVNAVAVLFAIAFIFLIGDGVISTSPGKVHEQEAAQWLRQNVSKSEQVLSFDNVILYRAGHLSPVEYKLNLRRQRKVTEGGRAGLKTWPDALRERDWKQHDYFVASLSRKRVGEQSAIEEVVGKSPVRVFRNARNDTVLVYEIGD